MSKQAVIVTGASDGLGAATAHQLGRLGANVVITARRAERLDETAALVRDAGGNALAIPGDLTDTDFVDALVERTVQEFDGIAAIVNNAGTLDPMAPIAEADIDAWHKAFEVNLFAPLRLIRAALPYLRANEEFGRIVDISSDAATKGYPTWGAYGASKAALTHMTQTVSAEETNIITVALCPGLVDSPMQEKIRAEGKEIMPQQMYERYQNMYLNGELLDPEKPGFAAAVLALHTPPDWSGALLDWDNEHLRRLCERIEYMLQSAGKEAQYAAYL